MDCKKGGGFPNGEKKKDGGTKMSTALNFSQPNPQGTNHTQLVSVAINTKRGETDEQ